MRKDSLKIQVLLVLVAVLCISLLGRQIIAWRSAQQAFQQSKSDWVQASVAPQLLTEQQRQLAVLHAAKNKQLAATQSGGELLSLVEAACREQGVTLLSLPQERLETASGTAVNELRFSLEGRLQDLLILCHKWEYQDRLGRLGYFKLAREQIRTGRKKEAKLVATLRFSRLL